MQEAANFSLISQHFVEHLCGIVPIGHLTAGLFREVFESSIVGGFSFVAQGAAVVMVHLDQCTDVFLVEGRAGDCSAFHSPS